MEGVAGTRKGWRVPAKVWRVPGPLAGTCQDLEWKGAEG